MKRSSGGAPGDSVPSRGQGGARVRASGRTILSEESRAQRKQFGDVTFTCASVAPEARRC